MGAGPECHYQRANAPGPCGQGSICMNYVHDNYVYRQVSKIGPLSEAGLITSTSLV